MNSRDSTEECIKRLKIAHKNALEYNMDRGNLLREQKRIIQEQIDKVAKPLHSQIETLREQLKNQIKKDFHQEIAWGEVKADCYSGMHCDEISNYWNLYFDGDKEDSNDTNDLILKCDQFSPGTKITISVPSCPKCTDRADFCGCGFNWKNWILNNYA